MNAVVGGIAIAYDLTGPAEAPVVVFVHGLAASRGVWQGQSDRLSSRFRVLRYDLRGHGDSDVSAQPCSRSDLANDLARLLDFLGIERAVVVGHSGGGVVAMQFAVDHPQRLNALVLVGTASQCNDKTAAWYEKTANVAREKGGEAGMREMGLKPDSGPVPDGPTFFQVTMAMRSLNSSPLTEALSSVSVPTLIIVGEKDFLGAGGSVILSRTIAGSQLDIVEGRGHGIYLEAPDWFADRLSEFLEQTL
jgi:pimeloyl-ACP methyl ester carboxylesterase